MTKYERLYTADEVDGMIARAKAAAAQPEREPVGSFLTREQAIEFCRRRRPSIEPTEQHIDRTIDAYAALFGDLVPAPPAAQRKPLTVDCIGLALDLETQSKRVESQTVERAMIAAANGLRIIEADHGIKEQS